MDDQLMWNLHDWMNGHLQAVEHALSDWVAAESPANLGEPMRYAVLQGGKRLRPLLVMAASEANGMPCSVAAMRAACAVELIHAYSLVHDDLPCMDNDVLRRGRPTCHVEFGEATALLVGDSLQTLAFELLAREDLGDASIQLEMLRVLTHASGSLGMAGGQAIDLDSVGRALELPELELMHALKTGALIRAAVLLGSLGGKPMSNEARAALDRFSKRAGLLFQVVDDILDCTASTATLGKTAGKDSAADKPTYVGLMGLEPAREFAEDLRTQTLESLAIFGDSAHRLVELTNFITQRKF